MKKLMLMLTLLAFGFNAYSQKTKISDYFPEYPIDDIKESYDENLNLIYNLKLLNKTKKTITHIVFYLASPLNGGWEEDTSLNRTTRAQNSVTIQKAITLKPNYSLNYKLASPNSSFAYAVDVSMVRYSDGSFKKFKVN